MLGLGVNAPALGKHTRRVKKDELIESGLEGVNGLLCFLEMYQVWMI